jgi:alpha-L-rhamnosidase
MGVPETQYPRVVAALQRNIRANKGHLDTGIFGTRFFFEVLAENGMHDLAYEAMNKREEPGFGHWIELGSTTTREKWDEGGSHNHPMFGGGLTWLYRNLAGMQADPDRPGYRHIIFKPQPIQQLSYVRYSNLTPFGKAGIHWENVKNQFTLSVQVPVGSSATVYIPAEEGDSILENGVDINNVKDLEYIGIEDNYLVYHIESGNYSFVVQ